MVYVYRIGIMILYHSSPSLFYQFRDLSHFGTLKAAKERSNAYEGESYLYTCNVDVKNMIDIVDYGNESHMLFDDLFHQKIISKEEHKRIKNILDYNERNAILVKILLGKNIKVMRYNNVAEDVNSFSYIVVNHNVEITSIRKMKG